MPKGLKEEVLTATPQEIKPTTHITVWKDGSWKEASSRLDAVYRESDPDWLVTIPLSRVEN